jgi:hypothetical protein
VRSSFTWIVVAAIGLLAALAVADALRPGSAAPKSTAATPTTVSRPNTLVEKLRHDQITGLILYADQGCRLHSLILPQMLGDVVREVDGAPARQCSLGASGGRVLTGHLVADPRLTRTARCRGGAIEVRDWATGAVEHTLDGCPFAWGPDGALTRLHRGAIVTGRRILYTRADFRHAARAHPSLAAALAGRPYDVLVTDFAWLDQQRLVAGLEIEPKGRAPFFLAALFDGQALTGIATSPRGRSRTGSSVHRGRMRRPRTGRSSAVTDEPPIPPAGLPPGQALAFSQDERWLAYANGSSIYLVGTSLNDQHGRIIRLPTGARDLVWEPVTSDASGPVGR